MVPIIRPFSTDWISALEPLAGQVGHEEWLSIAWTFGLREIFERTARMLVLCASTNAAGQCLNAENQVLDDFTPPGIIGEFRALYISLN